MLLISLLFTLYAFHCTAATCEPLDAKLYLADADNKIQDYSELVAGFYKSLDWIQAQFAESDNNRYTYMLVAVLQLEITTRSHAIRSLMEDRIMELYKETSWMPLEYYQNSETLRDATLNLLFARARLRTKITMLRANERHWTALYDLMTGYANEPLMGRMNATLPRDSLELEVELRNQSRRLMDYVEAREALGGGAARGSSAQLFKIMDAAIDRRLECAICDQLRAPHWTNAAPLGPNYMIAHWLRAYVKPRLLKTIQEARAEIGQHVRVTNLFDLLLQEPDKIKSFQRRTLEMVTAQQR